MEQEEVRTGSRTAEEIAWDQEFRDDRSSTSNLASDLRGLAKFAIRLPGEIIQMPMNIIPEETARHARAAVRESFLAVRSLFDAFNDRIEDVLAEPGTSKSGATVKGPPGTWGTGRAATERPLSSEKVKRIEIGDDSSDQ